MGRGEIIGFGRFYGAQNLRSRSLRFTGQFSVRKYLLSFQILRPAAIRVQRDGRCRCLDWMRAERRRKKESKKGLGLWAGQHYGIGHDSKEAGGKPHRKYHQQRRRHHQQRRRNTSWNRNEAKRPEHLPRSRENLAIQGRVGGVQYIECSKKVGGAGTLDGPLDFTQIPYRSISRKYLGTWLCRLECWVSVPPVSIAGTTVC